MPRENLTNLIIKPSVEPKKRPQSQTNETEDAKKQTKQKQLEQQQTPSIHTITIKPNNPPPLKKSDYNESPLLKRKTP